jgi:hypothetical protein
MFQMTAEEQKRLLQTLPAVAAAKPNGVAVASK